MTGNTLEDMTDDELEAAQRAVDGEVEGANPNANADETSEAGEANPPSEAAAAKAAGAEEAGADAQAKVEGIASKDGSRILPYAALQAERRSRRHAESRYESTARELDEAKQLIADMKAGKTPEAGEVTEDDVAQMEEDFPEQGRKMRMLFERAKAAQTEPAATASTREDEGDDPVQDAIDQVPLLVGWQANDAEKFARAQEHDAVLINSPKWANKSAVERFTEVAKLVADEYDIPFPDQKTSGLPTPSPARNADVRRAQPNTLSDFKGGAIPDHGTVNVKNMSPQSLLGRYSEMTDAEIDADLARLG